MTNQQIAKAIIKAFELAKENDDFEECCRLACSELEDPFYKLIYCATLCEEEILEWCDQVINGTISIVKEN